MTMMYKIVAVLLLFGTLHIVDARNCSEATGKECKECVEDFSCYYCSKSKVCAKRDDIKPASDACAGDWYAYGQCNVSGKLLIIILPCVGGVVLLIILFCVYWCCCRKISKSREKKSFAKDAERRKRDKEDRNRRYEEQAMERRNKHDEIRKKYGLFKDGEDSNNKYSKFENE